MKLLCVEMGNNTAIYKVDYKKEDILTFIDFINSKHKTQNKEIIKTTFVDKIPTNFGHLDNKAIKINSYKIKNIVKPEPVVYNGLFFPEDCYGNIEVNYEYNTNFGHILKDTFLSEDDKLLLDMTDLIKYRNAIYDMSNQFKFDKTIDLNNKENSSVEKFKTVEKYNDYLSKIAYDLNEPLKFVNEKEFKKMKKDLPLYTNIMYKFFVIEEVAMYPTGTIPSDEYKIMERFAKRNKDCNFSIADTYFDGFFQDKLFSALVDYDGAQLLNDVRGNILKSYDLDGFDYNINTLRNIKNNQLKKELK